MEIPVQVQALEIFDIYKSYVYISAALTLLTVRAYNLYKVGMLISFFPEIDFRFEKIDFFRLWNFGFVRRSQY